jgi:hypothetical protein
MSLHKQGHSEADLSKPLGSIGHEVGLFDQYPMPNMAQNFMDPMQHVNPNLNIDMQQFN